VMRTFRGGLFW